MFRASFKILTLTSSLIALATSQQSYADSYSIQVGAFSEPSEVTLQQANDTRPGEAFTQQDSNADLHRYYIGRFTTRAEAEAMLKLLRTQAYPDAFIATFTSDANNLDEQLLAEPATFSSPNTKQLTVWEVEKILSKLSSAQQEKVVINQGQLWLNEGEQFTRLSY